MDAGNGGSGEAIPAVPAANDCTARPRVRAVMSSDKLEMVCNTLLMPSNMKQFGFMLGLTKTGRARPRSGEVISAFCKYLNENERVKIAGWFVGEDAMSNWIKEIRKLAEEAQARKDANAAKGHPNGALQEPSHIEAARELMEFFYDFEKQAEKNPQNRYTTPPQEVIDQIGEEACRPQKFPGASLEDGDDLQNAAMERVASKKQGAKRKLTEEGMTDEKAVNRAAYKTATRPQAAAPEASSLDLMFSSIGALMSVEAKRADREDTKAKHEVDLVNIEKMARLGSLLQLPGTTAQFKKSIQEQMEKLAASDITEEAAPPLDSSPAGILSPQGPARSISSATSSLSASPSGGLSGA